MISTILILIKTRFLFFLYVNCSLNFDEKNHVVYFFLKFFFISIIVKIFNVFRIIFNVTFFFMRIFDRFMHFYNVDVCIFKYELILINISIVCNFRKRNHIFIYYFFCFFFIIWFVEICNNINVNVIIIDIEFEIKIYILINDEI